MKISELCPVFPLTSSFQLFDDRRAMVPISLPLSVTNPSKSSATSARLPAAINGARVVSIGSPLSSSSPVMWTSMFASLSVPAACIARRAATITVNPPLSSPAPGPSASSLLPSLLRTKVWNGLSGSKTVSRCAMSSSFLVPFLPVLVATRCPARLAAAMSCHSSLKPKGSNSARIISAIFRTPSKFIVPEFWLTMRSSKATERSYSASTVAAIFASALLNCAVAGTEKTSASPAPKRVKDRRIFLEYVIKLEAR